MAQTQKKTEKEDRIIYALQYLKNEATELKNDSISKAIDIAISISKNHWQEDLSLENEEEELIASALFLIKSLELSHKSKTRLADTLKRLD